MYQIVQVDRARNCVHMDLAYKSVVLDILAISGSSYSVALEHIHSLSNFEIRGCTHN